MDRHDPKSDDTLDQTAPFDDTSEDEGPLLDVGEPILVLIAHPEQRYLGKRYHLEPGSEIDVGRSPDCEIDFPDVPSVSRVHARIGYDEEGVWVQDLGSTNGTLINHRRAYDRFFLTSGDRIQFGSIHFKFLRELDTEAAYFEILHQVALQDSLTELANKRRFDDELEREFSRARRHDRKLTLILFDIDDFKQINDTHGHLCGDFVLQEVAEIGRRQMRREEILARIGGDEFGILNPEVGTEGATALAERLRAAIAEEPFAADLARQPIQVSCSFGVAELMPDMPDAAQLFRAADRALYSSKHGGRNRVTVADASPEV